MPLGAHSLLVVGHGLFVVRTAVAAATWWSGRHLQDITQPKLKFGRGEGNEKGLRCASLQGSDIELPPTYLSVSLLISITLQPGLVHLVFLSSASWGYSVRSNWPSSKRAGQLHPRGSYLHCRHNNRVLHLVLFFPLKKTTERISGRIVNPHSRERSWELNNFNIHRTSKNKKCEPKPSFPRQTTGQHLLITFWGEEEENQNWISTMAPLIANLAKEFFLCSTGHLLLAIMGYKRLLLDTLSETFIVVHSYNIFGQTNANLTNGTCDVHITVFLPFTAEVSRRHSHFIEFFF